MNVEKQKKSKKGLTRQYFEKSGPNEKNSLRTPTGSVRREGRSIAVKDSICQKSGNDTRRYGIDIARGL